MCAPVPSHVSSLTPTLAVGSDFSLAILPNSGATQLQAWPLRTHLGAHAESCEMVIGLNFFVRPQGSLRSTYGF